MREIGWYLREGTPWVSSVEVVDRGRGFGVGVLESRVGLWGLGLRFRAERLGIGDWGVGSEDEGVGFPVYILVMRVCNRHGEGLSGFWGYYTCGPYISF